MTTNPACDLAHAALETQLVEALQLAETTIERLSTPHGPFNSAQGTLDVVRAAIDAETGAAEAAREKPRPETLSPSVNDEPA